jgi:protein-S-isoprenylcysteine O-methyltransferase Ste14
MKHFPDLPPVWLVLAMAAAWVLAAYLPLVRIVGPVGQGLGLALAGAGLGLIAWAAWWFWRKKTTIEPHHDPGVLIVEGPYRIGRNPIYLGMVAILAGMVLWLGAISALPVPFAFAAILTRRFILPEEAALRRAFGARGHAYLAATRRWV